MNADRATERSKWEPTSIEDAGRLYDVAHARSGDKGDTLNVVVIPFDDDHYEPLVELVTPDRVRDHFAHLMTGEVTRHPVPGLSCINFVLTDALDGGVTRSMRFDRHGKTLSRHLLAMSLRNDP